MNHAASAPLDFEDPSATALATHTLLYIEDDPANTALMGYIIALRPAITLRCADSGVSGIIRAQECQPDLVLLDLHLPDISGDQVLKRLRGDPRTAEIPVIMLTGDTTATQIKRPHGPGICRYMTKPFNVRALLDSVDTLLQTATP